MGAQDKHPAGIKVRAAASGRLTYAQQHDSDYRIVDEAGQTIGWLRGYRRGSRRVWGISATYNGDFTGSYADMAHAVEGLLFQIAKAEARS